MLEVGMKAPDFTLNDKDGNPVSLSDFAGSRVVVYFYPKDSTPGCTRQACGFRDAYTGFRERGIEVIGISRDGAKAHQSFAAKQELPFLLLSDPERTAIEGFGVWQEKKLYGKVGMGIVRSSFVIGPDGMVEQVIPKAKPDTNAAEILAWIDAHPL